jgi:hypothetical protein
VERLEYRTVPSTVFVGPTRTITTISAGIAAAMPFDTVQVDPGTYTEQITINKYLTVQGAGAANSIIQAPLPLKLDALNKQVIVEVTGGVSVTFSGFTVRGPGSSTSGSIDFGIWVNGGAGLNVTATTISDIRDNPVTNAQTGLGIMVGSSSLNQVGLAGIIGDTIFNYQKGGIVVANPGSNALIEENTVTGLGNITVIAQNGIQVGDGATATVTLNTVSGNEYSGPGSTPNLIAPGTTIQADGILLLNPGGNVTVSFNNVFGNDAGISSLIPGFTAIILANGVVQNRFENIVLDQGNQSVTINTVNGGNIGVAVVSYNGATGATGDSFATLVANVISGTGTGIELLEENNANTSVIAVLMTPATNQIFNNQVGLNNTTPNLVTVPNNWWGSPSGPSTPSNPKGRGNPVVGNVSIPTIAVTSDGQLIVPLTSPDIPLYCTVSATYKVLIGRTPETGGLVFWVNMLKNGATNLAVAKGIYESPEHRGVQVDHFFTQFLHRAADPAGRAVWVSQLEAGVGEIQVMLGFLCSPEYMNAHPSNTALVTGFYQDILNRSPDAAGLNMFVGQLQGGASCGQVALSFLNSMEFDKNVVDADYLLFLSRPADPSGEQIYVNGLQMHQPPFDTIENLALVFLTSPEYLNNPPC